MNKYMRKKMKQKTNLLRDKNSKSKMQIKSKTTCNF